MNDSYRDIAVFMMIMVTVYAVVDQVIDQMGLPPLMQTYITIGLAVGGSYLWNQRRRCR